MLTILAFIVTIGILVTVHEYGHFQVARWCGVHVLRFSVGFGKPLWLRKFGQDQTEFVLAAIPLGGYVKMLDENELKAEREQGNTVPQYSEAELSRAFNRQPIFKRMLIVLAGPVANLLLAIGLYWVLLLQGVTGIKPVVGEIAPNSLAQQANFVEGEHIVRVGDTPVQTWQEARWELLEKSLDGEPVDVETTFGERQHHVHQLRFDGMDNNPNKDVLVKLGLTMFQPKIAPIIGEVLANSAAEKAGLQVGDVIQSLGGTPISHWAELVRIIQAHPGKVLNVAFKRGDSSLSARVTPDAVKEGGISIGRMGAGVKPDQAILDATQVHIQYSPSQALIAGAHETWRISMFSLRMLKEMVLGRVSVKGISGPISIATYAGESAQMGLKFFLSFLALVSISIGVLNLLPIPVLDGGHLMYYMAEFIRGTPVSESAMLIGQKIGVGILGLLMIIAMFNDLNQLFAG